jgi:hypothetical protein
VEPMSDGGSSTSAPSLAGTQFYLKDITPLIDKNTQLNQEATRRALETLRGRFVRFHGGVEPLVKEMTRWGTRFGILGRMARDKWDVWWKSGENKQRVAEYVNSHFQDKVLSSDKLKDTLQEALGQFRDDVSANRNLLYSEIKLALSGGGPPVRFDDRGRDDFVARVMQQASEMTGQIATATVVSGLAALVGGTLTQIAVEQLTIQILTRVATQAAASAATAAAAEGGAIAASTSGGGILGSLGGPAGTAIGIGVGLVVGVIVDWWMSDRFEDKLTEQIVRYLNVVEHGFVEGTEQDPGLQRTFDDAVRLIDRSTRQTMIDALMQKGSP